EFSPATQLSTEHVAAVEIHPVRELLATDDVRGRAAAEAPRHQGRFRDGLARLAEGLAFEGMESLGPLLFDRLPNAAELLAPGGWVVMADALRTRERMRRICAEGE